MTDSNDRTILVLDYDGTLHNSRIVYEAAFRTVMNEISDKGWIPHEDYTSEEINYWIGFSAPEMWERFHPELSDEQKDYAGRRIGRLMMDDIRDGKARLYNGVPEVMDRLKEDYELIFLSNCMEEYSKVHRKAFGLDRWFDRYFCTGYYGFKQKEQVFAEHIYKPGRRYIAVGDRIKDITLAAECGLGSIGCLYGFGSSEELQGADLLINDISELPDAVRKVERLRFV